MSSMPINYSEIVSPARPYLIYNPAPYEIVKDYAGYTFRWPPNFEDRGYGPGVLAVGELKIRGQHDQKYRHAMEMVSAQTVAKFFVGEDGLSGTLSPMGVRPLFGDNRDADVRLEADAAFRKHQEVEDLRLTSTFMGAVERMKQQGMTPPPPGPEIMAAMERQRINRAERGGIGAMHCPKCAWALATKEDLDAHTYHYHPELIQTPPPTPPPVPEVPVLPVARRALPRPAQPRSGPVGRPSVRR